MTQDEAMRLIGEIPPSTHLLMTKLLLGTGIRLMECLRLRVKNIDYTANGHNLNF